MRSKIPAARPSRGVALDGLLVMIGAPLAAALAWTAALTGAAPSLPAERQTVAAAVAVPTFRAVLAQVVRGDPTPRGTLDASDYGAAGGGARVGPLNTTSARCESSEPCGWFGCSFRLGTAEFPDTTDPDEREIVRETVRERVDQVAGCYEERSRELPAVDGWVFVDLDIAPDGEADARLVESADVPMPDLRTARCVAGTLRTWVFPALAGPGHVTVRYSFKLSPPE